MRMLPEAVPVIERRPVRLRPWTVNDTDVVASAAADPLIPLISTVPTSTDRADLEAYVDRQHRRLREGSGFSFAIAEMRTNQAVGSIGLWTSNISAGRASTGYWIGPQFRRRGYAMSALHALTTWALSLPEVERLELYVEPWNEGSWRAAESVGYQREGLLRAWQVVGPDRKDMYIYSVLPDR